MALIFPEDERHKAMEEHQRKIMEAFIMGSSSSGSGVSGGISQHIPKNRVFDLSALKQLEADKKSLMEFVRKLQDGKSWH